MVTKCSAAFLASTFMSSSPIGPPDSPCSLFVISPPRCCPRTLLAGDVNALFDFGPTATQVGVPLSPPLVVPRPAAAYW